MREGKPQVTRWQLTLDPRRGDAGNGSPNPPAPERGSSHCPPYPEPRATLPSSSDSSGARIPNFM